MSLVHRDHFQWWTNRSILKEDSPLLQKEHTLLLFTDAFLKGWGTHLRHPQPVVYVIRKSQGSTYILQLKARLLPQKMIHKSASESKSVDFHRQFISGCQYEQPGRHPLSSNMYLDLNNHGLDECQDDSDSGKCIPRNLNVLVDSLSREIRCFQTKGAMNHQVFNQIQSVVDVLQQR